MLTPTTLIVAATRANGIGLHGRLPWPMLKSEMAYFARVTQRVPPGSQPTAGEEPQKCRNAVVMGRKTWESIPPRFRPLKDRINLVVSRSVDTVRALLNTGAGNSGDRTVQVENSLGSALQFLSPAPRTHQSGHYGSEPARVFVIGGAEIYASALNQSQSTQPGSGWTVERILLTRILAPDFECDTFFPIDLEGEVERGDWRRMSTASLEAWTGEDKGSLAGIKKDGDVEYEFSGFERTA